MDPYLANPPDEPGADAAQDSASNVRKPIPELPPELDADDLPGAFFGYDRYSIVKILDGLRERFRELWEECVDRDERVRELELELLRNREGERLIGETLVSVQRETHAIRENARREAQELLRAARKQANRIQKKTELEATAKAKELVESAERERKTAQELLSAARKQADRIQEETELEARAKANELVDSAERERKTLLDEAGRAKTFIEQTHEQLSDFLLAAVKWYEEAKPSLGAEPELEPEVEPEPEPAPVDEPVREGYP